MREGHQIVDVHVHFSLTERRWREPSPFEFERDDRLPCSAYISRRQMGRLFSRIARRYVLRGQESFAGDLDAAFEQWQFKHLLEFEHVDRVVLLAFDEVYDDAGAPRGPATRRGEFATDMYVSNGLIHELCRRHPDRFLFGASIHPYRMHGRQNAVELLDEVAAAGAVLIKWLPTVQNIDASDPRSIAFLRRCAELRLPVLAHYGTEFTLVTNNAAAADPGPMLSALRKLRDEGAMPTVIVAHVATPMLWPVCSAAYHRTLLDALAGEFADQPLYADISGFTSPSKLHWLKSLLRRPEIWPKLVNGSDFPIPAASFLLRRRLRNGYKEIMAAQSWIDRDYLIKRTLGLPDSVFARAATLLRLQ